MCQEGRTTAQLGGLGKAIEAERKERFRQEAQQAAGLATDSIRPAGAVMAANRLTIHGLLDQEIERRRRELDQLVALRNWLPGEVPPAVEEALWQRFQWGPR